MQGEILVITAVKEELEYRIPICNVGRGYAGKILDRAERPMGSAEYLSV
mgnify:CR=1 FL=1